MNWEQVPTALMVKTINQRGAGFPRIPENLENENGHGKVMEHEKLAKSHGILISVMEYNNFAPELYQM